MKPITKSVSKESLLMQWSNIIEIRNQRKGKSDIRNQKSASEEKFFHRMNVEMTLEEAIASVGSFFLFFIKHHNIKRHQHSQYEQEKASATCENLRCKLTFRRNIAALDSVKSNALFWVNPKIPGRSISFASRIENEKIFLKKHFLFNI